MGLKPHSVGYRPSHRRFSIATLEDPPPRGAFREFLRKAFAQTRLSLALVHLCRLAITFRNLSDHHHSPSPTKQSHSNLTRFRAQQRQHRQATSRSLSPSHVSYLFLSLHLYVHSRSVRRDSLLHRHHLPSLRPSARSPRLHLHRCHLLRSLPTFRFLRYCSTALISSKRCRSKKPQNSR